MHSYSILWPDGDMLNPIDLMVTILIGSRLFNLPVLLTQASNHRREL
jgi:hypothetical protein